MKIYAKVAYTVDVSIDTNSRNPEVIKEKIIEASDKLFNRQFSDGVIIMCSVPEVIEKEEVLWMNE
jgi:hypothetical protein